MALPITFDSSDPDGIDFVARFAMGRMKPHHRAGAVYAFFRGIGASEGDDLIVQKTVNPDTTDFTELTFISVPGSNSISGIATWQSPDDDDIVHIATTSGTDVKYSRFNMATDAFVTSFEAVTGAVTIDVFATKVCSIAVETDGSVIIEYQAATDNNMGAKQRVDYAFKPIGGSWTSNVALDDGGAVNYHCGALVRGEANKFHLTFHNTTTLDAVHKSVQDVDGTLSSGEDYNSVSTDQVNLFQLATPVYYDDDGVERVTLGHQTLSEIARSAVVEDDGTPEASIEASLVGSTAEAIGVANSFGAYSFAVDADDKSVWIIFGRASDDDVYRAQNQDDESPWQDGVEELDAVDVNIITSNIYTRGTDVVLAYIYEDGTAIKYNEFVIRAVGAIEKAASDALDLAIVEGPIGLLASADVNDTTGLTIFEVAELLALIEVSDSADIAIADAAKLLAILDVVDSVDLAIIDAGVVVVLIDAADTVSIAIVEAAADLKAFLDVVDTAGLAIVEGVPILLATISVADTVDLAILESAELLALLDRSDVLDLAIDDAAAVVVIQDVIDTLDLTIAEVADLLVFVAPVDTFDLAIVEGVPVLLATASVSDTLDLAIIDLADLLSKVSVDDTLDLAIIDASAVDVVLAVADTLGLTVTEVAKLLAFIEVSDTVELAIGQVAKILAFIQVADTLDLALVEAAAVAVELAVNDTLDLVIDELAELAGIIQVNDVAGISISETAEVLALILTADTLDLAIGQIAEILVFIAVEDNIALTVDQVAKILGKIAVVETLDLAIEDATALVALLVAADTLGLTIEETAEVVAALSVSDAVDLAIQDAAEVLVEILFLGAIKKRIKLEAPLLGRIQMDLLRKAEIRLSGRRKATFKLEIDPGVQR